jgi:hypothetical protein
MPKLVTALLTCVALLPAQSDGFLPRLPYPEGKLAASKYLFERTDLSHPDVKPIAAAVASGKFEAALDLWRDRVVERLRRTDFVQFGWHGASLSENYNGYIDVLVGATVAEAYYADVSKVRFIDIWGMTGKPGQGKKIDWSVELTPSFTLPHPALAKLDRSQVMSMTGYDNFEFLKHFVARYWQKGDPIYLDKAFELSADFCSRHAALFWNAYGEKPIDDRALNSTWRADWRVVANGLNVGWRMKNFLRMAAGFSKCAGADKPEKWDDILRPVAGKLSRADLDRIPAEALALIVLSQWEHHTPNLMWFSIKPGAVPNQRSEGLKSLAMLALLFPEFKAAPQLLDQVARGYEEMLEANFLPDGGSLEQSFNYNEQDKEGLEELFTFVETLGGPMPAFVQAAVAKAKARREIDLGLRNPLGGLPQVGNSHDVLGKAVWESPAALAAYLASSNVRHRLDVAPQAFLSKAFPYSGFYAQREGWGPTNLMLFFMNGRSQRGHSMRDNLAIQVWGYGRQLVVCGGDPNYGVFRTPEAKGTSFFTSEQSSLKNNTVIVDGRSQSKNAPRLTKAPRTPVSSRWHTSGLFDLVDGRYDLGYGDWDDKKGDINIDMSVTHERTVIFSREARCWVIEDRMANPSGKPHRYTQLWNFPPRTEDPDYAKQYAGFREAEIALDAAARRFATADPHGPNMAFYQAGPKELQYEKYYGDREKWLGWHAAGIGDARPALNVHASWGSEDDTLVTLMLPLDKGQPAASAFRPFRESGVSGFDAVVGGVKLAYRCAAKPTELRAEGASAVAQRLFVQVSPSGATSGLCISARRLSLSGKAPLDTEGDFEFSLGKDGQVKRTPFFLPEVPAIEEPAPFAAGSPLPQARILGRDGLAVRYTLDGSQPSLQSPVVKGPVALAQPCTVKARYFRGEEGLPLVAEQAFRPRAWPLRPADLDKADGLVPGLKHEVFPYNGDYARLYETVLGKPALIGRSDHFDLKALSQDGSYAVRWSGYLKIPADGIWIFTVTATAGCHFMLWSPRRDLVVPSVVRTPNTAKMNTEAVTDAVALKAGLHRLRVEMIRFKSRPQDFKVEVEGPGVPRQVLPATWLLRDAAD